MCGVFSIGVLVAGPSPFALVLEVKKVVKVVVKMKASGKLILTIKLQCFDQFVKSIFLTSKTNEVRYRYEHAGPGINKHFDVPISFLTQSLNFC